MVRFDVLGAVDLPDARGLLQRPKRLGLFAYLVLARPRGFHRRDALLALFWPEMDDRHARGALRQSLHWLRKAFGADILLARGDEEIAVDHTRVRCDVIEFESLLDTGRLADALELYRGELLPAFHIPGSSEIMRWLEEERDFLRRRAVSAAVELAQHAQMRGEISDAVVWSRRALQLAPYDDSVAQRLIQLLDRSGARGEAIAAYEMFAARLRADMELDPSPETAAIAEAVRLRHGGGMADPPPADTTVLMAPARAPETERPTLPVSRTAARRVWPRHVAWLGITIIAIAAFLGTSLVQGPRRADAVREALTRNRVAIFPFDVRGNPELAPLREGMADLLGTKLDGTGELRTVDVNALLAALRAERVSTIDPTLGLELAERFDAATYVLGALVNTPGGLHGSAFLYDEAGELRATVAAVVEDERMLHQLVDSLALQLVATLPIRPGGRLVRLGAVTTESFDALKAYLDGERLMRAGLHDSAIAAYQQSVDADTAFALAWYRMAIARHQLANPRGRADAHRRALVFADRLAPRDRQLLEAFDALERHQDIEAERLYRNLLSVHPDDVEAWALLGEIIMYYGLWRGRSVADARHAFEQALSLDPTNFTALRHLSWIAAQEERFGDVAAFAERMLELQPDGYAASALRMQVALFRRDAPNSIAGALEELRLRDSDYVNWAQRMAHFTGSLEGRDRVARLLTAAMRPPQWRLRGHVVTARYLLDRGRWRQSMAVLDSAMAIDTEGTMTTWGRAYLRPFVQVSMSELQEASQRLDAWQPAVPENTIARLYLLGAVQVLRADTARASRYANALRVLSDSFALLPDRAWEAAVAEGLTFGLRARIAASTGRWDEAHSHLERIEPSGWWRRMHTGPIGVEAFHTWLRAETLNALGRHREALTLLAPLGFMWGDAGTLAPKHLRMAEIYERLGDRDLAARHYARFIELWAECDPELRWRVTQAEARLERLRSSAQPLPAP